MPFVVDWHAADRAKLVARAQQGAAVVRFDEHSLKLLPACTPPGAYQYTGFTPRDEVVTIHTRPELYANLPQQAPRLQPRLQSAAAFSVVVRSVGRLHLDVPLIKRSELLGRCSGATHFIRRMDLGAYGVSSGEPPPDAATAQARIGAAQNSPNSATQLLHSGGTFAACSTARVDAAHPPSKCSEPLRIELVPLGGAEDSSSATTGNPNCGEPLRWNGSGCISPSRASATDQTAPSARQPAGKTAVARPSGFECEPQNTRQCLNQCRLGSLLSCVHFGYHLRAGAGGVATDEPRAIRLWQLACNAGEPTGCTALHLHHFEQHQWRAALAYGSRACLGGDAESCANMATLAFEGRGTRRNQAAAFGLWQRACKMRDYAACDRAGFMMLFGIAGSRRDPEAACEMLSHACEAPGQHGCGNLALCFEHGLGGRRDLGEAIALNLRACLERGDARGCVRAGLLVEESSSDPDHRSKALDLYERGCAMPPEQSCMSLDELQRYLPDGYSAEGLDRRACQNAPANALACYNAAIAHERGYGGHPDRDQAQSLLERACKEGGLKKACRAPRLGRPQRI